jgi:beta-carotene ketolase (CrtO type)
MYDVVVVGAGINGLTCAAYLARAGKRVLVLEANPHPGGFAVSQPVPGAPGFVMNTYAIEFPFADIKPSVVKELGLERFGLRFAFPDPNNTYVGPDGGHFANYHSLDQTCASMAKLSKKDAEAWRRLMTSLTSMLDVGLPYLADHPTRPSLATLAEIVGQAAKHRKRLVPAARILLQSPMEILEDFETEEVRAWIAMNVATGSFRPLDEIANVSILVYFALNHKYPIRRPVGGSGAFIQALLDSIRLDGGEVRTCAPVERITVTGGRATGVVLQSGEEIRGQDIVAAIDPTPLFTKLLEPSVLSASLREEVRKMRVLSSGVSHLNANIAVSRRPTFPKHDITPAMLAGLSFAPSVDYVNRLMDAIKRGELGEEQPFYIGVPSVLDRSLVPDGSEGESIWMWVGAVPLELSDGRDWQDAKQARFDHIIDKLETYSPGFRDSIVGVQINSPDDFNTPWVYKGSSRSVDLIPSQIGPWRPSPSLSGYDTPEIEGLWRSGHGTHPMSGTGGWPGRLTARTMLKRPSRRGGRGRATWPRPGGQATARRTPHRTGGTSR